MRVKCELGPACSFVGAFRNESTKESAFGASSAEGGATTRREKSLFLTTHLLLSSSSADNFTPLRKDEVSRKTNTTSTWRGTWSLT